MSGELCPIRWTDVRLDEPDLLIARAYVIRKGERVIKGTKTHQRRRPALDAATVEIFNELRERQRKLAVHEP